MKMRGNEHTAHITTEQARIFERRLLRQEFEQQPLRLQLLTIARVKQTLRRELQRGQVQPSALRQVAASVYNIRTEELQP